MRELNIDMLDQRQVKFFSKNSALVLHKILHSTSITDIVHACVCSLMILVRGGCLMNELAVNN